MMNDEMRAERSITIENRKSKIENPKFSRYFLLNLRTSAIVVIIVAVGLYIYAALNGEEVEWDIVTVVAIGMALSSAVTALFDSRKNRGAS